MSGERAETGRALDRAARLGAMQGLTLTTFDTRGSPEGAREAARSAMAAGPDLIIGPASSEETRALEASVPIFTLSNDESLQVPNVFVLGITATQSTSAVLTYARSAGARTIAIIRAGSDWSARCEAAALAASAKVGLRAFAPMDLPDGNVVETLRKACDGKLPDAVLLPQGGPALEKVANPLRIAGLQLLGTSQWSSTDVMLPAAQGAWIAAADPQASARFAETYVRQFGDTPGVLAGLAYDAVLAATILVRSQRLLTEGLIRAEGFSGVTGLFRFTDDARSERRLAVVVASPDGARGIAGKPMPWT